MKKILGLSLALVLSIVMVFGVAVPVFAGALDDLCAEFPEGPLTVSFDIDGGYDLSYVRVTTLGGVVIVDGTYEGWCGDLGRSINVTDTYTAMAYCSYNLASFDGLVDNEGLLDEVNWILNQDFVGQTSPGGYGVYTFADVQAAIWTLLDNADPTAAIAGLRIAADGDRTQEIIDGANANNGFVPGPGGKLVVLLAPMVREVQGQTVLITIDIPEEDYAGCTPGFWKNNADKHGASAWVVYSPGDDFNSIFGTDIDVRGKGKSIIEDPTLLEALGANGGGINALARHAVAALLNISNPNITYPMSEGSLIADVAAAIAAGEPDVTDLKDDLDEYNNAGCSVDQHGDPIIPD
jgi:hypothetical protein